MSVQHATETLRQKMKQALPRLNSLVAVAGTEFIRITPDTSTTKRWRAVLSSPTAGSLKQQIETIKTKTILAAVIRWTAVDWLWAC
jgi:hypothetical protein